MWQIENVTFSTFSKLVRILQNRRLGDWSEDVPRYLISELRHLDPMGYRKLTIPAQTGQPKREAHLIELADWCTHRWVVEEYHNGLKTGCRIENRRLQKAQRLHPR
jgi:hypothetical protein